MPETPVMKHLQQINLPTSQKEVKRPYECRQQTNSISTKYEKTQTFFHLFPVSVSLTPCANLCFRISSKWPQWYGLISLNNLTSMTNWWTKILCTLEHEIRQGLLASLWLVIFLLRQNKLWLGPTVRQRALIKKKIKFSSYIRKFRGIGCKVIYD